MNSQQQLRNNAAVRRGVRCTRTRPAAFAPGRDHKNRERQPRDTLCAYSSAPASQRRVVLLQVLAAAVLCGVPASADSLEPKEKLKAIKRIVKLLLKGDYDELEDKTDSDAFVFVQGPKELPYSGKYVGKDCVRQFMTSFGKYFAISAVPEIYYYLNESGSVFVAMDLVLQPVTRQAEELQTSVAFKIKVNDDGELKKIAWISDTLTAYQAIAASEPVTSREDEAVSEPAIAPIEPEIAGEPVADGGPGIAREPVTEAQENLE